MKWVLRIGLALAVLVGVVLAAAVLVLPSLVESDEVRSRIERAAYGATGRQLHYESLAFGLFPPSLRVIGPRVSGETPTDAALLEAREVSLRVALLPLLARTVLIDSLVVDAATLRLVRGPSGLVLPQAPEAVERGAADAAATSEEEGGEPGPSFSLAVRSVQLRGSTLQLDDRSVRPAVAWQLTDLEATARGESLAAPIALELGANLASGGSLTVSGTATPSADLDLEVSLDGLQVGALAPYLGNDVEVTGALSGDVGLRGPAAALDRLVASLRGADVRFRQGDTALAGALTLEADVQAPTGAAAGSFEVDATDAALEVGGGFTKPPGVPARVTGRIAAGSNGALAIDDVRLVIRNLEAQGRVSSLSPFAVELSSPAFELGGWEALVPALAATSPSGKLRLERLRFASQPPALRGTLHLDGVEVQPREGAALRLRGALVGDGNALHSEGASLETAGQVSQLALRVSELFTRPRYHVELKASEADSNQLLSGLLAKPDTVYGPLGLDLALDGALAGDPLQSLAGRVDFGIESGRLVGVSLLRSVIDRLGTAGSLAIDLGKLGGRDLQRFYGDEFELLRGAVRLRDGIARTDDLTLRYRGYAVRLAGTLGLADLALDMAGELTLREELDAVIAKELGTASGYQPRQRVVPLARVGGTLAAPKVRLDSGVAVRFAAAYASEGYAGKLREKAERELGPGGGDLVDQGIGVLEGLLGGGRRSGPGAPADPPAPDAGPADPEADPPAGS